MVYVSNNRAVTELVSYHILTISLARQWLAMPLASYLASLSAQAVYSYWKESQGQAGTRQEVGH